ncbi:MAG: hypothetical protein JXR97_04040 [Planctomycetes bacterium]|nr:hypothetical protein [Planctomycetota bacterium]
MRRNLVIAAAVLFLVSGSALYARDDAQEKVYFERSSKSYSEYRTRLEGNFGQYKIAIPEALQKAWEETDKKIVIYTDKLGGDMDGKTREEYNQFRNLLGNLRSCLYPIEQSVQLLGNAETTFKTLSYTEDYKKYREFLQAKLDSEIEHFTTSLKDGKYNHRYSRKTEVLSQLYNLLLNSQLNAASTLLKYPALKGDPVVEEYISFCKDFSAQRKADVEKVEAMGEKDNDDLNKIYRATSNINSVFYSWNSLLNVAYDMKRSEEQYKDIIDTASYKSYLEACTNEMATQREYIALLLKPEEGREYQELSRLTREKTYQAANARSQARNYLSRTQSIANQSKEIERYIKDLPEEKQAELKARMKKAIDECDQAFAAANKAKKDNQRHRSIESIIAEGEGEIKMQEIRNIVEDARFEADFQRYRSKWAKHKDSPELQESIKAFEDKVAEFRKNIEEKRKAEILSRKLYTRSELLNMKADLTDGIADKISDVAFDVKDKIDDLADEVMEKANTADRKAEAEKLQEEADKIPEEDPVDDEEVF